MQTVKKIAGESWDFKWTMTNFLTKVPFDLTGYSISFAIKSSTDDTVYLYGPVSGTHNNTGGVALASVPKASTLPFPAGQYIGEFQRSLVDVNKKKQFIIEVSRPVITT